MYYISIPSYPNPYSTTPLTNAVGAVSISNFDHLTKTGRIELAIYADLPSAEAAVPPIARRSYPIPAVDVPTTTSFSLPSLVTLESQNAQVFGALVGVFYQLLLGDPALAGAKMLGDE